MTEQPFTPEVLVFLDGLLGRVTLSAGEPDFAELATTIIEAKRQIARAMEGAGE